MVEKFLKNLLFLGVIVSFGTFLSFLMMTGELSSAADMAIQVATETIRFPILFVVSAVAVAALKTRSDMRSERLRKKFGL